MLRGSEVPAFRSRNRSPAKNQAKHKLCAQDVFYSVQYSSLLLIGHGRCPALNTHSGKNPVISASHTETLFSISCTL